jgi:hypothetical protein
LFPLLTLEQVWAAGPEQQKTLVIEIGREAAFAIAFGVWDVVF